MATTFRFEVKKQPNKLGKYPIFIRITKDRRLKRIKTAVELNRLSDWNAKAQDDKHIRASERNYALMNKALEKEMLKAKQIYWEDSSQSADTIANKFKGNTTSFVDYLNAFTEKLKADGDVRAKHYKTFCLKIKGFMDSTSRIDIAFADLSPLLLGEFESYLKKCTNANCNADNVRLNPNYIKSLMVKFRAIVNKAIKDGLMPVDKYPFKNYKLPKGIAVDRQALDESEIKSIIELELTEGSRIWDARNCFMFSFYCAGIRVGDLLQLRWNNVTDEGTRLQYVMGKTQTPSNYLLMPEARQILSYYYKQDSKPTDYIFPFLDSTAQYAKYHNQSTMPIVLKRALLQNISSKNSLINKELGNIARLAGISKHLSFHISRHSFASIAKAKNISSKVVQEALGHTKLVTTESYLHTFGTSEIDKAFPKIFSLDTDKANNAKETDIAQTLKNLDKETLARVMQMAGLA